MPIVLLNVLYIVCRHRKYFRSHAVPWRCAACVFDSLSRILHCEVISAVRFVSKRYFVKQKCPKKLIRSCLSGTRLNNPLHRPWAPHTLHSLLPPEFTASQNYSLRPRVRNLQLPDHPNHLCNSRPNFIVRMLFRNVY